MLDRPPSSTSSHTSSAAIEKGVPDRAALIRFLVHRQFNYLAPKEEADSESDNQNFIETELGGLSLDNGCSHVGWNGRWNKKADTCYCWWVAGTLSVSYAGFSRLSIPCSFLVFSFVFLFFPPSSFANLIQMINSFHAVNIPPSRAYLLSITQHHIGGFSKYAGGHPDLYHSYLGLAALAVMGDEDLKDFDVGLCCSRDTLRKIELARGGLLRRYTETDGRAERGRKEFWEAIQAQG